MEEIVINSFFKSFPFPKRKSNFLPQPINLTPQLINYLPQSIDILFPPSNNIFLCLIYLIGLSAQLFTWPCRVGVRRQWIRDLAISEHVNFLKLLLSLNALLKFYHNNPFNKDTFIIFLYDVNMYLFTFS